MSSVMSMLNNLTLQLLSELETWRVHCYDRLFQQENFAFCIPWPPLLAIYCKAVPVPKLHAVKARMGKGGVEV